MNDKFKLINFKKFWVSFDLRFHNSKSDYFGLGLLLGTYGKSIIDNHIQFRISLWLVLVSFEVVINKNGMEE
jgi:hypothetical protein